MIITYFQHIMEGFSRALQSILSKLAQGRDLPFDPEKRVYRYSSLTNLFDAENIIFTAMGNKRHPTEEGNSDESPRLQS